MYKQIYYAIKSENSKFRHFHSDIKHVKLSGGAPYFKVRVKEAQKGEKSDYWGWKDFEKKEYSMIYPSKMQAEACFTYGYKIEEKRGRGKLVNLVIEEIKKVEE